jgi:hypothetical protein
MSEEIALELLTEREVAEYLKTRSVAQTQFMSQKVPFWREIQRLFSKQICRLKDLLPSWLV